MMEREREREREAEIKVTPEFQAMIDWLMD